MLYFLLTLEYDGYDYHGFAKQKNAKTIQDELEKAFFASCQLNVWTTGVSRTDAGVHAIDQKVFIKLPFVPNNLAYFFKTINKTLPANINIKKYQGVEKWFNFRNVKQKEYVYTINDGAYDLDNYRYELLYDKKLNENKLHDIAQVFVGYHDFRYFTGVKDNEEVETKREIEKIYIHRENNKIKMHFLAKGFIRYQIRMIVQNILACYNNKVTIPQLQELLTNPPATTTCYNAKPHGLCLVKIEFLD